MAYKNAIFSTLTEDEQFFKGIYDPTKRWNGWAMPYFDFLTSKAILETQVSMEESRKYGLSYYEFTNFPNGIIEHHEDGVEFYKAIEHEGKLYYPIGCGNWTWAVVNPEDEISEISENKIDEIFNDICKKFDLKSGDITPCQSNELEDIKSRLFRLLIGYVEQNVQG